MSTKSTKKYFWLKLQETFFDDETVRFLEDRDGGEKYVLFYLKLLLKSLKNNGYLIRTIGTTVMPYDVPSLARLTNTDPDTVRVAIELYKQIGIVDIQDSGALYMTQLAGMVGAETTDAARKRIARAKSKEQESRLITNLITNTPKIAEVPDVIPDNTLEANPNITSDITTSTTAISAPETNPPAAKSEIERDIDDVLTYLNDAAGTNYRLNGASNRKYIKACLRDGYTTENLKAVVRIKCKQWRGDERMDKYIRPQTLFAAEKVPGYLEEATRAERKSQRPPAPGLTQTQPERINMFHNNSNNSSNDNINNNNIADSNNFNDDIREVTADELAAAWA